MNKYNPLIHHRRSIRLKGYDYSSAGLYFITMCCQDRINRFGHVGADPCGRPNNKPNGRPENEPIDLSEIYPNGLPEMTMNQFGQIAYDEWVKLSERFPNFKLDVFQIMPNHVHTILFLKNVGMENKERAENCWGDEANNFVEAGADLNERAGADLNNEAGADLNKRAGANFNERAGASPAPTVADIVGAYKSLVANRCLKIYKSKNETMGKFWQRNYYEHIIRNEESYQTISNYIMNNPAKWDADKFYKA